MMPQHIAIIIDGNRRWARAKGLPVVKGHEEGARNLARIVDHCDELKVKYLTIYALSTENWRKRAKEEVKGLFDLLEKIAEEKREDYKKRGIKMAVLGHFQAFPKKVVRVIEEMLKIVKKHERMKVNLALNYGGRDEIIRAVQNIVKDGVKPSKINERLINKYLYTSDQPDPDLIIRTGGELRLSNFLLWQLSYSELYFTDILWPDFSPKKLEKAIAEYQKRLRRFGK